MAERATIFQTVALFPEATPGTSGAATRLLSALSISPGINAEIDVFKPMGQKYMTVAALGKEWTEAPLEGKPTYNEINYPLSSVITTPTPTSSTADTAAWTWTYTPNSSGADTPKTFTVEFGSTERAANFAYGIVKDLTIPFSRSEVSLTGNMFGRAITDGITLSTAATRVDIVPVLPKQGSVYLDTSSTALGTTRLVRVLSGELRIQNRFDPLWVVNDQNASFVTHVEIDPTVELDLLEEADSSGMANLTAMRAGTRSFIRVEFLGTAISTSTDTHLFRIDLAGKITNVAPFEDADGVYAVKWTWTADGGSTWGQAYRIVTRSSSTGL